MTIDEAIAHAREVASRKFDDRVHCIKCAEEHKQLADWLEELKANRIALEKANGYLEANYKLGYNKAIDEAMKKSAEAICIGCGYLNGYECTYKGANCQVSKPMLEVVVKALEQLKAGEKNDT